MHVSQNELRKALRIAYQKGIRKGQADAESKFDTILERMDRLKQLNGSTAIFKDEWNDRRFFKRKETEKTPEQVAEEVWQLAPDPSHVDSFRFLETPTPAIEVTFKAKGNRGESTYRYDFPKSQQDTAQVVWEELSSANHPGIVIWEWLIRGGVPYTRLKSFLKAFDPNEARDESGKWTSGGGAGKHAESGDGAAQSASDGQEHDHAADYKANGTRAKAFKAWFGDWENDPANASKVVSADGEPQETHNIPGTGSKVVKDGKPVVVYHGTASGGFEAFDKEKIAAGSLYGPGFYFTEDQSIAEEYQEKGREYELNKPLSKKDMLAAKRWFLSKDTQQAAREDIGTREVLRNAARAWEAGPEEFAKYLVNNDGSTVDTLRKKVGANRQPMQGTKTEVKSLYLNIRNPFDAESFDETPVSILAPEDQKALAAYKAKFGDKAPESFDGYNDLARMLGGKEQANAALARAGFDGITHIGGSIMGRGVKHRVWIAFEPHQIKAVQNEGTFDPTDPRIHKAARNQSDPDEIPDDEDSHALAADAEEHPHGDAAALAMLEHAIPALELGEDPLPGLRAIADAELDETVEKASWDEAKHPRDDHGRFVSRDAIHEAKSNPAKAAELRARVTDPGERKKLDDALEGKTDLGRTQRGEQKQRAEQRRYISQQDREKATALISKLSEYHAKPGAVKLTRADLKRLAEHIPHMNIAELRRARMAMRANLHGDRLKADMVARLVSHARGMIAERIPERKRRNNRLNTIIAQVMAYGGIRPDKEAIGDYGSLKDLLEDNIPMSIFRSNASHSLDTMAQELVTAGHIRVPENTSPSDYLLDLIRERAHTLSADISRQHEEALNDYYKRQQEAAGFASESEIEAAIRGGEKAGRIEAQEDLLGQDRGDSWTPEDEAQLDDSFDFGANVPAEPAAASPPSPPSEPPPTETAQSAPEPHTGDVLAHATNDHRTELSAIQPGGNGWVAGHFIRRMPDGRYQVETHTGYQVVTLAGANAHIQKMWRRQASEKSKIEAALGRVKDSEPDDPFGVDPRASAGRAKIPHGARGVSLDENTRGRTGMVFRDESGGVSLHLDGGGDVKAQDFEPLNPSHSWREPRKKETTGDLFGGAEESTPSATTRPETSTERFHREHAERMRKWADANPGHAKAQEVAARAEQRHKDVVAAGLPEPGKGPAFPVETAPGTYAAAGLRPTAPTDEEKTRSRFHRGYQDDMTEFQRHVREQNRARTQAEIDARDAAKRAKEAADLGETLSDQLARAESERERSSQERKKRAIVGDYIEAVVQKYGLAGNTGATENISGRVAMVRQLPSGGEQYGIWETDSRGRDRLRYVNATDGKWRHQGEKEWNEPPPQTMPSTTSVTKPAEPSVSDVAARMRAVNENRKLSIPEVRAAMDELESLPKETVAEVARHLGYNVVASFQSKRSMIDALRKNVEGLKLSQHRADRIAPAEPPLTVEGMNQARTERTMAKLAASSDESGLRPEVLALRDKHNIRTQTADQVQAELDKGGITDPDELIRSAIGTEHPRNIGPNEVQQAAKKMREKGKETPASPSSDVHSATVVTRDIRGKKEKLVSWPFHTDTIKKISEGSITADELRKRFAALTADPEAVKSHLAEQLKKTGLRSPDKIKAQADSIYDRVLGTLALGQPVSYTMPVGQGREAWNKAKLDAHRKVMEGLTDEHVRTVAAEYAAGKIEREKRKQASEKALSNPETGDEFRHFIDVKGEGQLSGPQREKWDEIQAEERRSKDAAERAKRAQVAAVETGGVGYTIHDGFHTKHQKPIHIVKLGGRVGSDTFKQLAESARKLGGNYQQNSKWTRGQSPDGFNFDTREQAERFGQLLAGQSVSRLEDWEQARDESKQSTAERLRGLAQRTHEAAAEALGRDRKTNTARRAEHAASADAGARRKQAFAETLARVADAIASGQTKHLDGIRAGTHLEALDSALRQGMYSRDRKLATPSHQADGRDPHPDDIEHAPYPHPWFTGGDLYRLAASMKNTPGAKRLGERVRKLADKIKAEADKTGNDGQHITDSAALEELSDVARNPGAYGLDKFQGDMMRYRLDNYMRLQAADIKTPAELRAALREYLPLKQKPTGADPIKEAERALIGRKIPGFFPTPKPAIDEMLDRADIQPGHSVLEPSAGKGDILDAVKERHPDAETSAIEPMNDLREILNKKGHRLTGTDFLEHRGQYDRIVMNPPFENGQDIDHVRHAYEQLKPGGRLVAIMSEGPFSRSDNKAESFRGWLDSVNGEHEQMPEGSFSGADAFRQTGVRTRMVTIQKPD